VVSLASLHLSGVRRCIAQWKTFGERAAHRAFGHVLGGQLGGLEKLWKDIEGRMFFFLVSVNHVFVASCIDHVDRSSLS